MTPSVKRERSVVGWLVALGALGWFAVGSVSPVQGYTVTPAPWSICVSSSQADLEALEAPLSPANNAAVQAGRPVTFSASSVAPVTFAVASSVALLYTGPNIDEGPGSAQAKEVYAFTSTKATATPGTIYWDASFSDATLAGCEGLTPTTYTTAVRTLTVLTSPAEEQAAAKKTQEEEAATERKREEESAAATPTGSVSLDASTMIEQSGGEVAVKLTCMGTASCGGKLMLTGRSATRKSKKAKAETIGTTAFSIPAVRASVVELKLNGVGRALLKARHGRLSATMTVLKSSPAPSQIQTDNVQLVQLKATKAKMLTR